jgi:hypothetical protein
MNEASSSRRLDDTVLKQHGNFLWRRRAGVYQVFATVGWLESGLRLFRHRGQATGHFTSDVEQAAIWAIARTNAGQVVQIDFGDTMSIIRGTDGGFDLGRLLGFSIGGRFISAEDVDMLIALVGAIEAHAAPGDVTLTSAGAPSEASP